MLTINQAAKESNMSYSSIRQLCLDRKIQFIRIGSPSSRGKYLINRNSLNDFLNGNSNRDTTRNFIKNR